MRARPTAFAAGLTARSWSRLSPRSCPRSTAGERSPRARRWPAAATDPHGAAGELGEGRRRRLGRGRGLTVTHSKCGCRCSRAPEPLAALVDASRGWWGNGRSGSSYSLELRYYRRLQRRTIAESLNEAGDRKPSGVPLALTGCVPFDFDCAEQVAEHDQSFAQHDHPPAQPRGMRQFRMAARAEQ
jgi:hypothetical protein